MPISFQCGQCNKPYVVSDGLAGKKAMCKQCGNRMTIPGDAATSSEPVAVQARPAASRFGRADLETNGRKKARIRDINAAKQEIMPRLMTAKSAFESEVRRVAMIPGAIQALNIMTSMARLESLEQELAAQNANLGLQ